LGLGLGSGFGLDEAGRVSMEGSTFYGIECFLVPACGGRESLR